MSYQDAMYIKTKINISFVAESTFTNAAVTLLQGCVKLRGLNGVIILSDSCLWLVHVALL
jgi:hypothetical protein